MTATPVSEIMPGIFRVADTCNVYVIRSTEGIAVAGATARGPAASTEATADAATGGNTQAAGGAPGTTQTGAAHAAEDAAQSAAEGGPLERTAIVIDFGSGIVLDHLAEMGIDRITDVLMTHHHRDQGQGLPRAVAEGIRIHVPSAERDLFEDVESMWQTRAVYNDYNLRQDRFSLLESVPVHDVVPDHRAREYGGTTVEVLPTPGHTTGSVSYLVKRAGRRLVFTGDLIYAPGKVWSIAATQWSFVDNEGPAMTVLSCYRLLELEPNLLLPSHGEPMDDPHHALSLLATRMTEYVNSRRPAPWDLKRLLDAPFTPLTDHLLMNRTSNSYSYVLLSRTGAALIIDYGYDTYTGLPPGSDRASRRPWLASIPALRRNHGVTNVEVALPTHYHDDHVAGMNLLRDVEGTEIWAPAHVADVLENPLDQDLPCTWYDPVPVDRRLRLGESVTWQEYEIMVHDLPGHTRYAAAYEFVVDGVRVLVTGDQQVGMGEPGGSREVLNYQYRNRQRLGDYQASAELYRRVRPDLMISGHWMPRWVTDDYLDLVTEVGDDQVRIHRDLLPVDDLDIALDGAVARIAPYYSRVETGTTVRYRIAVSNPRRTVQKAELRLVLPVGWVAVPDVARMSLPPLGREETEIEVTVGGPRRRARIAVDVSVGELHLGQHAEAVVDVTETT